MVVKFGQHLNCLENDFWTKLRLLSTASLVQEFFSGLLVAGILDRSIDKKVYALFAFRFSYINQVNVSA